MQLDAGASQSNWKEIKGVGIFFWRTLGHKAQNLIRVFITALAKSIKGPSCSTSFLKSSCFQSLRSLCLCNREDVTGPKPERLVNQVVCVLCHLTIRPLWRAGQLHSGCEVAPTPKPVLLWMGKAISMVLGVGVKPWARGQGINPAKAQNSHPDLPPWGAGGPTSLSSHLN